MSLLDRIIDGAASGDPAELLRNMLVLAKRLKAEELESWVLAELNGYEDGALPEYRGPFTVPVLANLSGPFGAQGKNHLSRIGLPDEYKALFEVQFSDPMASLVGLAEATDTLTVAWDPWAVGMYNGLIDDGKVPHIEMMGVYSAWRQVPPTLIKGIIDQVRTKALQFALDLQEKYPDAGESGGPTVADPDVRQAVTHITNVILGDIGALAQGGQVSQTVIAVGDIVGALEAAKRVLTADSLLEFHEVLAADDAAIARPRVESFIDKVKSGAVNIGTGIGINIAADALFAIASQFFGWS